MKNFNNVSFEGRKEIISIIIEELEHNCLPDESIVDRYGDLHELHNKLFNDNYFIVGYYESEKWLKNNWTYGVFDAIDTVVSYEKDNFGESNISINPESICNMLVYIIGEELIYSLYEDMSIKKAIKTIKNI